MKRKQNQEELRAKQYLQSLNYTKVEYEPLGNVTPDFVLDNKIAVEVRRLNRNYIKNEQLVSSESCEIDTHTKIKKNNLSWSTYELHRNIQLIINEKDKKIEQNFSLYDEWLLILIDCITCKIETNAFEKLKKIQFNKHKFSKIIILSSDGEFKAFKF
ncbi:MAG: hypothetical protein K8R44_08885 [Sulfurimonas sp.]|nr:hypothetical protein [Sulfurimonas sp.]